jgi:crotonobetainyl-CoA:carnitine CoA-transferase CaiB-like acyl-CoA transferase
MNFMALNRGKRSIVIDLKTDDGREQARRLVRTADVVVENFRPGVTTRLGIDEPSVRVESPDIVYCSITGFGSQGPYRDRPALDLILQGMGGVMDRQGRGGEPKLVVITVADVYAAALGVQGILAALLVKERGGGGGQLVEVDLFRALMVSQAYRMMSAAGPVELAAWEDVAPYQAFEASDGWFNVAVVTERTWRAMCEALERPDLLEDGRFDLNSDRVQHREALVTLLTDVFRSLPVEHWLGLLGEAGVPCGPILTVEDLFTDPHVVATEGIVQLEHDAAGPIWTLGVPFTMTGTPLAVGTPAPSVGQHTDQILAELDSASEVAHD